MTETHLIRFLTEEIEKRIENWKASIALRQPTLAALPNIDLENATYQISLCSLWEQEGEKHVQIIHTGSLQEAVTAAESEFKKINNRSDVQADYLAHLVVGKDLCYIPQKYYVTEKDSAHLANHRTVK